MAKSKIGESFSMGWQGRVNRSQARIASDKSHRGLAALQFMSTPLGAGGVTVPETVGHFGAVFGGRRSPSGGRGVTPRPAPTCPSRPDRSKPTASAQTCSAYRLRSCTPCSLAPYLASPCRAPAALFVRGTSRRLQRHNSARHFPLSSTRMRRSAASPSRTARSNGRYLLYIEI